MKIIYVRPYPKPPGMRKDPVLWKCTGCGARMIFFLKRCQTCKTPRS